MNRWLVGAAALAAVVLAFGPSGCKKETVYKDTAETTERLKKLEADQDAKQKYISQLEAQIVELKAKGSGDEILVTMDGEVVVNGKSGSRSTAKVNVEEQAKAFAKHVSRSNGAVRKCYQTALKKDSSLEARTITVTVKVSYDKGGKVSRVGMDKKISSAFSGCLQSVARNWSVPPAPKSLTFQQRFALTPQ